MSLRNLGFGWLQVSITIASIIATSANSSLAQITPDETLHNNSQVRVEDNTRVIEGGTEAGDNLFHSFSEFSVPTGSEAWFNNSAEIQNIFSRVTGGSVSDIDGLIRANGAANLFLLNPNGIIFGPNASLDVGGSFVGTSAESLKFADGSEFSAVNPQSSPLLTVNVPMGLQYGLNPGEIAVNESRLQVNKGQTLGLIGGNVSISGGESGFIEAEAGRVELGGLAATGLIGINGQQKEGEFSLESFSFPEAIARANVQLSNFAYIDVRSDGGGSIAIDAKDLNITGGEQGGSILRAGIAPDNGSPEAIAGDLTINATDNITVSQGSGIVNQVSSTGVGNAGNINITTTNLTLTNGGFVDASTFGQGDGGSVEITATDTITFDGEDSGGFPSGATSGVASFAVGDAGGVRITTGSLSLTNGGFVDASTFGQGDGGSVEITATDTITFDGEDFGGFPSHATSRVASSAVGDAGGVRITTGSLSLTNGGFVDASTFGQGDGGSVEITATDTITFDGEDSGGSSSGATSGVDSSAVGDAGDVSITTGSLSLTNGGRVSASTFGRGNAGNLTVTADESIEVIGRSADGEFPSALFVSSDSGTTRDVGNLTIETGQLLIQDGAVIGAGTFGEGNAGDLIVTADESIEVIGRSDDGEFPSGLSTQANPEATEDLGALTIQTGNLPTIIKQLLKDRSQIGALTIQTGNLPTIIKQLLKDRSQIQIIDSPFGEGNEQNLTITANETTEVIDSSANINLASDLLASSEGEISGDAGDLKISTGQLLIQDGAQVSAGTFGAGNGGNLQITASESIEVIGSGRSSDGEVIGSGLSTQANQGATGNAGDLKISTGQLLVQDGGQVSASTFGAGNGGNLQITANESIAVIGGSANIPSGLFTSSEEETSGDARDLTIETGQLLVQNGGQVSARTLGAGNGGNLTVTADTLQLQDGGTITAQSTGTGIAGNINIEVNDNLNADNGQILTTAEESSGGDITITAGQNIFLRNDSDIRTTLSTTTGSGGDITLNANAIVALEDSDIFAFAPFGSGGNITFDTNAFLSDSLFNTTAQTNDPLTESELNQLNGNNRVDVNATGSISSGTISGIPDTSQLQNSLTQLTTNAIDTEAIVASSCVAPSRERRGTFYIVGQASLPYRPGEAVPSVYSAVGVQPIPQETPEPPPTPRWKKGDPIIEPTGVYLLENGQRILSRECGT